MSQVLLSSAYFAPIQWYQKLYRYDKVTVELSVLMAYGHTIPEVGRAVQDGVKNAVESMTGLEIAAVNVNVGGITFPPAAKA